LQLLQPEMILAMGRFAITSLLASKAPIAELRLRRHSYAGVPLVVTYHPAYLLRNLTEKARAWEDLCFARAWAEERRCAGGAEDAAVAEGAAGAQGEKDAAG
jgi:DNA polymerase